ncbi:MAG: PKD domain-containing protein [Putridiphycobacter sp.]|nr:PKD domain-containing protein [Putridiphycobacter sp.]
MKFLYTLLFVLASMVGIGQNTINGYEYWFDSDFSNKTSSTITPVTQLNLNTNVSTATLSPGVHTISFRSWDQNGLFSSPITQFFYKIPQQSLAAVNDIIAYEYWFDHDYNSATYQTTANSAVFSLSTLIGTTSITAGVHSFSIRFKDNGGLWSSPTTEFFYKIPIQSTPGIKDIIAYEYWFDDNYTSATTQAVTNTQLFNLNSVLSTSSINTGVHSFSVRFKDNAGIWSSPLTQFFYKIPTSTVSTKQITMYEYWYDSDFNNAVQTTVSNQVIFNLSTLLSSTTLNTGVHTITIRCKDNANLWSSPLTQFFYKLPNQNGVVNNSIRNYRYWFNDDFSDAIEVSISSPSTNFNLLDDIDMTQIPHGMHSIHFQFRDSVDRWSSVTSDSIQKIALPIAEFTVSSAANCDSTIVTMINHSIDADTYLWDFDGLATSDLENPTFTFTSSGTYTIQLTVTDTILNIDSTISQSVNIYTNSYAVWDISECASYTSPSGLYTWTSSGTYNDTITNNSGCDSILTINLNLNQSSSTISEEACLFYIAPDGATYTTSGQYVAIIPNAFGCDSIISINLTINTVDITVIQVDNTLTASSSGAAYQWVDCNNNYAPIAGETNQSFSPNNNGIYAVIITENNCSDTSQCFVISTINIMDSGNFTTVSVFPNPTEGHVYIKFGTIIQDLNIQLYDSRGRLILDDFLQSTDFYQLDITEPSGVYFLRIFSPNFKTDLKIVKSK